MIIGPQRTGTTWLSRVLNKHPNINITRPKEPHYFNNLIHKVLYKEVSKDFTWYLSLFDVPHKKRYRVFKELIKGNTRSVRILRGEATASTAVRLTPEFIRFIYEINPKIKIIFGVRDPVERAWSALKLSLVTNDKKKLDEITLNEMLDFCSQDYVIECGLSSKTTGKWLSVIPEHQFFIFRFTELVENPLDVFTAVCHFLNIHAPSNTLKKEVAETGKVNTSADVRMPPELRAHLENIYRHEIEEAQQS